MANRLTGLMRVLIEVSKRRYASALPQLIAFAALERLDGHGSDAWRRMLLAHADVFSLGAAAPDADFKDFKNHVLYPRDGYWGGAPDKAQIWYRNFVQALKRHEWETASYCAGVLSHYVSDVTDPFNTQWSDAGGTLHAAVRRSMREDFYGFHRASEALGSARAQVTLVADADFLVRALGAAADRANAGYEKAIAHYDLGRGATDPRAGFDVVGQRLAAELMDLAVSLSAAVLARGFADAAVAAPSDVNSWRAAALQLVTLPAGTLQRWQLARDERRDVLAMHDEVTMTGNVEATLPEHDRRVRDAYRIDVVAKREATPIAKVFPFEPSAASLKRVEKLRGAQGPSDTPEGEVVAFNRARVAVEPPRPAPRRTDAPPVRVRADLQKKIADEAAAEALEAAAAVPDVVATPLSNVVQLPRERQDAAAAVVPAVEVAAEPLQPVADAAVAESHAEVAATGVAEPAALVVLPAAVSDLRVVAAETADHRVYLRADQDIVDAPSIGPKMAELFRAVGLDTVEDFLRSHPIALAARLEAKDLDADTLEAWQDQCRLVMSVPGLRGTHAQLLVGAGYRSLDAVAAADVETLCADVLTFAVSKPGLRILRDGAAPSIERVRAWAEAARSVRAA